MNPLIKALKEAEKEASREVYELDMISAIPNSGKLKTGCIHAYAQWLLYASYTVCQNCRKCESCCICRNME